MQATKHLYARSSSMPATLYAGHIILAGVRSRGGSKHNVIL